VSETCVMGLDVDMRGAKPNVADYL